MKITKLGHCCLLIEENGVRILTDPGTYSSSQNEVTGLDAILITHEHADHLHMDSLKIVREHNRQAQIITNSAVAQLLEKESIPYTLMKDTELKEIKALSIEAFEAPHAEMYPNLPRVLNTGFFIGEKLFYPGDAYIEPQKEVDVLALPVAGPWVKLSEAIDYALRVKPKNVFPVHDGILKSPGLAHRVPEMVLSEQGISFTPLLEGEIYEC